MVQLTKLILITSLLLLVSCGQKGPLVHQGETLDKPASTINNSNEQSDSKTEPNKETTSESDIATEETDK